MTVDRTELRRLLAEGAPEGQWKPVSGSSPDIALAVAAVNALPVLLDRLDGYEDIAAAILYLATPASSYVTGQVLAVDGGLIKSNLDMPLDDL